MCVVISNAKAVDDINYSGNDYADGYIKRLVTLRALNRLSVQQHTLRGFFILRYVLFLA